MIDPRRAPARCHPQTSVRGLPVAIKPKPVRVAAVLAAALLATACSSPTAPTGGPNGAGTLVVATAGEPDTLNPVLNYGVDGAR
ncbi:hypothetical protein V2I01_17445 [Micromonospora sp. BRA006-A]|nr:hypothetical protein [Micromonospora sp. BRA006-A]